MQGMFEGGFQGEKRHLQPRSLREIDVWGCFRQVWLVRVNIPEGVTKIGDYAFGYCPRMTDIIPADA